MTEYRVVSPRIKSPDGTWIVSIPEAYGTNNLKLGTTLPSTSNTGGKIEFHWNGSSTATSTIEETSNGTLSINGLATSNIVTTNTNQTISSSKTFTAQTISLGDRPSKAFKSRYITRGQLPVNEADCTIDEYDSEGNRMSFINMGQNVTGDGFIVFHASDYQGNGDRAVLRTNRVNNGVPSSYLEIPMKGNTSSTSAVNKDWIWKTDANADNGLMHRTANEAYTGIKSGMWTPSQNKIGNLLNATYSTPLATNNASGYFDTTASNKPPMTNLVYGYREVRYFDTNMVMVIAYCIDTSNNYAVYINWYNSGWKGWKQI